MERRHDSNRTSKTRRRARILVVEDDPYIGRVLKSFFEGKGYVVTVVVDGVQALQHITAIPPYDLVLLDVQLPKKDGFEVLREARRSGVDSAVIMLTVRDEPEDKLMGFELGADDYVTKPFVAEELEARVEAVLKRYAAPPALYTRAYRFGAVDVDFGARSVYREGDEVDLTRLEFDILQYLIEHRGRTVSRKQFLRDVWGVSGEVTTRTIDRHVASLRKKIEPDPKDPIYIETVYGVGYKFVA